MGPRVTLIFFREGLLSSLSCGFFLREAVHDARPPRGALPYLIRERSISYVPSASVLAQLLTARRPAEVRSGGFRLFGFRDPEAGNPLERGGGGPRRQRTSEGATE